METLEVVDLTSPPPNQQPHEELELANIATPNNSQKKKRASAPSSKQPPAERTAKSPRWLLPMPPSSITPPHMWATPQSMPPYRNPFVVGQHNMFMPYFVPPTPLVPPVVPDWGVKQTARHKAQHQWCCQPFIDWTQRANRVGCPPHTKDCSNRRSRKNAKKG